MSVLSQGNLEHGEGETRRLIGAHREQEEGVVDEWHRAEGAQLKGVDSGIDGMIRLREGASSTQVAAAAATHGISVTPLPRYRHDRTDAGSDDAIILGYGALSEGQIQEGVEVLARIVRSL